MADIILLIALLLFFIAILYWIHEETFTMIWIIGFVLSIPSIITGAILSHYCYSDEIVGAGILIVGSFTIILISYWVHHKGDQY